MKILVTGGAGLVGSHAAEYYAKRGHKVTILDNLLRSSLFDYNKKSVEYNWNYLGKYKNIKRVRGDVRSKKDVLDAIGIGVDACIHAAGQPGVPSSIKKPLEDFSINAYGTLNVLESLRNKCRNAVFIYCSTNKVFGENVDKIALSEKKTRYYYKNINAIPESLSIDHTGHTPYGASKLVGDIYAQEYAHIYGMKTAVFRMSCIYGARQFGFEQQGWVAWFVIASLLKKRVTIFGNGKQVRDLLYVTDLIDAFDKFIRSDIKHDVFNIGGGKQNTISLLELIAKIEELSAGKMKVRFRGWRPSDQKVYISDLTKIRKKLGWKPSVTTDEGIKNLTAWVKVNRKKF
jgi:CDP-paratose 2-epimerase